jgi:hypothetical protein
MRQIKGTFKVPKNIWQEHFGNFTRILGTAEKWQKNHGA